MLVRREKKTLLHLVLKHSCVSSARLEPQSLSLPFSRLVLLPLLHLHIIFSSPSSLFLAVPILSTAIVSIMASDAQKQI